MAPGMDALYSGEARISASADFSRSQNEREPTGSPVSASRSLS